MTVSEFLKLIWYKPKWIGNEFDGVVLVNFRKKNGFEPNVEFGVKCHSDGQYFYYDMINFDDGYEDGEMVDLGTNSRRRFVLMTKLTKKNAKKISEFINDSLSQLYSNKITLENSVGM